MPSRFSIRLAIRGIREMRDFNWRSACPTAQLSNMRPVASIRAIIDAANNSCVSNVAKSEITASKSEPIVFWRRSRTNE